MATLNTKGRTVDVGIVMMVEPGRYEYYAVLLVSSILAFAYDDVAIHAYCRRELMDGLHPETLAFLEKHGVELEAIDPEFAVPYPQGNKLYACAAKRNARATVLMDTDIMLVRQAQLASIVRPGHVSGRLTGDWMWGATKEIWETAYRSVGLELPRYRMMRVNGAYLPPSISAGFTSYEAEDFGAIWRDVALEIEEKRIAKRIYPTLDQISLPVAAEKAGLRLHQMDPAWNRGGDFDRRRFADSVTHHYQNVERLQRSDNLWLADAVIQDFSRFANLEELVGFYEAEGAHPPEVHGNEGYWETVVMAQRAVDGKHLPGGRPRSAG